MTALALLAAALLAQQGDDADARASADKGLLVLRQMVTERNHASMGFEALKDAATSALGDPLKVHLVRLDELKTYAAGADADKLVHPLDKAVYPVLVGGAAKAAITVEKSGGAWKATTFGQPTLAKAVFGAKPKAGSILVQTPAYNLSFVGNRDTGKLLLTATMDDVRFGLKAGSSTAAADLFARLAPIAQKDDGLPK